MQGCSAEGLPIIRNDCFGNAEPVYDVDVDEFRQSLTSEISD